MTAEIRPGEIQLDIDPAGLDDARLAFIGTVSTPWSKGDCPRNLMQARERLKAEGGKTWFEIAPAYRQGLLGLRVGQPILILYWLDRRRRDLIVQSPGHVDGQRGVFALRSPIRPNPIGAATVTITALDDALGRVEIDAVDCFDGTPLLDIKPWLPTIDEAPA